jgi:Flp pilus assembly protein TadD
MISRKLDPEVSLGQKGDREGEIRAFREAIRLQPNNALSHFNLGMALRERGDMNGEIAAYREVIRL